jgi:hypothetical protein
LEVRLALNQLEAPVLRAYSKELQRRMKALEQGGGGEVAGSVASFSSSSSMSPSSQTSFSGAANATAVSKVDIYMDGLETYNMAGNYRYVNRFGLDSAAMLLHKKGKLKVDYKQYIQDVQDLRHSGPIKFFYRLIVGVEYDDPFPEPDLEIEKEVTCFPF